VVTEAAHTLMQASYRGSQPWAQLQALAETVAPPPTIGAGATGGCTTATDAEVQTGKAKLDPAQCQVRTASTGAPTSVGSCSGSGTTLRIHRDADEWSAYSSVGSDPVLHVELAKRNRLLLVAPACANTLASAALGLCGNLLGSVWRAWYYDLEPVFAAPLAERYGPQSVTRPVLVAPAMNTFMWHQRITRGHLDTLEARGVQVVQPVSKRLACGDVGDGAMADVADIVDAAVTLLRKQVSAEEAARREGRPDFALSCP
jgi:phosphopantothenoylcysteine decarboxylase